MCTQQPNQLEYTQHQYSFPYTTTWVYPVSRIIINTPKQPNQLEVQWCPSPHTFVPNGTWMGRRALASNGGFNEEIAGSPKSQTTKKKNTTKHSKLWKWEKKWLFWFFVDGCWGLIVCWIFWLMFFWGWMFVGLVDGFSLEWGWLESWFGVQDLFLLFMWWVWFQVMIGSQMHCLILWLTSVIVLQVCSLMILQQVCVELLQVTFIMYFRAILFPFWRRLSSGLN